MGTLNIDRRWAASGNTTRTAINAARTTPRIREVHQHVWRVFYTKPRAEMAAEKRLEQNGFEVLLPKRAVLRTWSDRKKRVVEPLFRSYIFAKVNEIGRLDILRDDAILTTVRDAEGFAHLRPEVIDALQHTQHDPDRLGLVEFPLPLVGMHRNTEYIIVRVDSIGQAVKINIPADWVRRITE